MSSALGTFRPDLYTGDVGDPSDDDVPTMTSSADLRRDEDASGADADDRTIQKPPDAVATIDDAPAKPSARAPRPAAGLAAGPADKLPPPPSHPLRPRLPSSPSSTATGPGPVTPAMRPRALTLPGGLHGPLGSSSRPIPTPQSIAAKAEAARMEVASADPVEKDPAKSDSKSDVRAVQSARGADTSEDDLEGPPTLESEPPPSEPATSPNSPAMVSSSSPAPHTPKMASAPLTAKAPSVPAKAAETQPPPRPSPPDEMDPIEGDPSDDSITATAPRVPAPVIPLSAPKSVEIRTLDDLDDLDDSADETEVKTLAADVGDLVRTARERSKEEAGGEPDSSEADASDDSVTAQAPVHPAAPAPIIRIAAKSLMPQASASPATEGEGDYDPDEEESVTARSLAVAADYPDDSVTTQSPSVPGGVQLPPAIDGETEGTTKRVQKRPAPPVDHASEADERDDSVTAAAPGHLTNMLRVIASPSPSPSEEDDAEDDDELQAHTQVMANAPVKPPPTSESGLRAAPHDASARSSGGDRASLGALGVSPRERRHSGAVRASTTADPSAMGPSPSDAVARAPYAPFPMPAEMDRKPPYALLVGVVAAISIAIPVILYIVLSSGGAEAAPRVTSQPSPDPVGVTGARPKASKSGPSGTASSQRSSGGNGARPGPFRR